MVSSTHNGQSIIDLQHLVAEKGSTQAFEKLYLIFYKELHLFASRIINSNHIAEEIVSDVFVHLWKKKHELHKIRELRIFLYVSVRNQALTYLDKIRREKTSWIDEYALNSIPEPLLTDEIVDAHETQGRIRQAIERLPAKCKSIYLLVREDGLKYGEAARLLNLSLKTIENQMGIALKKLALQLQRKGREKV